MLLVAPSTKPALLLQNISTQADDTIHPFDSENAADGNTAWPPHILLVMEQNMITASWTCEPKGVNGRFFGTNGSAQGLRVVNP
jgi:hypothetical protein